MFARFVFRLVTHSLLCLGHLITQRLLASPEYKQSRRIALYVSCERLMEVETRPLIDSVLKNPEKRCFVPLVFGPQSRDMKFLRIGA